MANNRSGFHPIFFTGLGVCLALALFLGVIWFRQGGPQDREFAAKVEMLRLATQMRLTLTSASETAIRAVLVSTDQASVFAEQVRTAENEVENDRQQLAQLLLEHGESAEKALFAQFTQAFDAYRQVDVTLLGLAVQNTNVKAFTLAFGPASKAFDQMTSALNRLVSANAGGPVATEVSLAAIEAQTHALKIQTLLAPHIAEAEDAKMDQLEAAMSEEDAKVRLSFERLSGLGGLKERAVLEEAQKAYAGFSAVKSDILALSRENTNVRSMSMSLDQKRKVSAACEEALDALRQHLHQALTRDSVVNPRRLTPGK